MPNFIIGRKPVSEALEAKQTKIDLLLICQKNRKSLRETIDKAQDAGIVCRYVSDSELARQCPGNNQGIAARVTKARPACIDDLLQKMDDSPLPLILALDHVQDPGNVGSMARTLLALGGTGIIIPKDKSAHLGTGAHKSSAGAIERIPVVRITNLARTLDDLKKSGFWIYGAHSDPENTNIFSVAATFPAILVLGNEEKGIRPNVLKKCDFLVRIPMPGQFESLNVAQAGAIICAELLRKKSEKS